MSGQIEAAQDAWTRAWDVHPIDLAAYVVSLHRMLRRDKDADDFIDALRLAGAPTE
jgi:hypothetical protein